MSADSLIDASLYLFNALPVQDGKTNLPSRTLVRYTLHRGFIFSPEVLGNYSEPSLVKIASTIGISGEQANSSFHKSWEKIATASIFQLVVEQILHYFSTYGVEYLTGEEHPEWVYIPMEELHIPDMPKLELKVVHGYTLDELKEKTLGLLNTGIALKDKTLEAVLEILKITKVTPEEISKVKNREFTIILYDSLGILPEDPEEFLRFLVYKTIGASMLIKDRKTISEISSKKNSTSDAMLNMYAGKYGAQRLAEIFYRYKPIFLAFKHHPTRSLINRVRKLAPDFNKPSEPQFLDTLSSKKATKQNVQIAQDFLKKVTVWRKMRILQALNYRSSGGDKIVYRIRNGKMFSTEFRQNNLNDLREFFNLTLKSLAEDIGPKVAGKKVYIPAGIKYGLPTSEKQFVGNVPSGTSVTVEKDLIVGIWWHNTKRRIDIDFSLVGLGGKFGWDAAYRNSTATVLFSGDMTDATNGASELFYLRPSYNSASLVMANYFNHISGDPVPVKFFLAQEHRETLPKYYMVDPSKIICGVDMEISEKQNVFGFIRKTSSGKFVFHFMEGQQGSSITSRRNKYTDNSVEYLVDYFETMIDLNSLLVFSGATLVATPEESDINLALEVLEKDTILNLFK